MKRLTLIFTLALCALAAVAQVHFTVSYKRVSPTEIDIIFNGTADKGWHVYGCHVGGDGPNPAIFGTDKLKGAKPKGALKDGPGIKKAYDEMFGQEIQFFEGKAQFVQRIELTEKTTKWKATSSSRPATTKTACPHRRQLQAQGHRRPRQERSSRHGRRARSTGRRTRPARRHRPDSPGRQPRSSSPHPRRRRHRRLVGKQHQRTETIRHRRERRRPKPLDDFPPRHTGRPRSPHHALRMAHHPHDRELLPQA